MAKVTVKLNSDNVKQWLKSQEMMDMLQERADVVLNSVNGCTSTQHVGPSRCNVIIETGNKHNIKTNAILKALR